MREPASPPRLLQLLRPIIPRVGHLGVFHGRLNVGVADPVLDSFDAEPLLNKCVAQQCFSTWKCRRCGGMPAAAPKSQRTLPFMPQLCPPARSSLFAS